MKSLGVLEKLSNVCGVTVREEVRGLMKDLLKPNVDETNEDKPRNVIDVNKGKKDSPTVMLAPPVNKIGLVVKTITEKGFLQFVRIGGIGDRILHACNTSNPTSPRKGHR